MFDPSLKKRKLERENEEIMDFSKLDFEDELLNEMGAEFLQENNFKRTRKSSKISKKGRLKDKSKKDSKVKPNLKLNPKRKRVRKNK